MKYIIIVKSTINTQDEFENFMIRYLAGNGDVLTYSDVVDILEKVNVQVKVQPDVELMIKNYIDIIRRDIVDDQQLIEICNKIYNKHKKALDLIFENRIDGKTQVLVTIKDALCNMADEGLIIYDKNWGYNFRTETMDQYLPLLDEPISSWKTTNISSYWFNIGEHSFYGIFELAGKNVSEELMDKMQAITDILKPNDKRKSNFVYKRIFTTKRYNIYDDADGEQAIEKVVRLAVKDILNMEKKVLDQLNLE